MNRPFAVELLHGLSKNRERAQTKEKKQREEREGLSKREAGERETGANRGCYTFILRGREREALELVIDVGRVSFGVVEVFRCDAGHLCVWDGLRARELGPALHQFDQRHRA